MTNFIELKMRTGVTSESSCSISEDAVLWSLRDQAGFPVPVDSLLSYASPTDGDHVSFKVSGGHPPKHEASTGRVFGTWLNTDTRVEYFPHVFGCKWVRVDASADASAVELSRALGEVVRELVREMLPVRLPELIRTTVHEMAKDGYFIDMANDGDYDDAMQSKLDDGDYMTPDSWDASDYADEIRETASVDIKEDVADIMRDMMRDNVLVVKFNPDH